MAFISTTIISSNTSTWSTGRSALSSSLGTTRCIQNRVRVAFSPICSADATSLSPKGGNKKNQGSKQSSPSPDDDEQLQNDRPFVMREFGKVSAAAVAIGLILFCFDIVVTLLVLSLAAVYGLAVLFDIRFITQSVKRVLTFFTTLRKAVRKMLGRPPNQ